MLQRRQVLALGLMAVAARPAWAAGPVQEMGIAVSSTSFVLGGERIGEQAKLFQAHGLQPRVTVMDSGNAAMSALIGGSVHLAVVGPPEVLVARARGQDIVIVANLYQGLAGSLVLNKAAAGKLGKVTPSSPVAERLAALNGLTVAVPSATSSLLGPFRDATAAVGAKPKFTYIAQGAMPSALESGAVDGIIASYPFAGVPLLRGTGVLWVNGPGGELPAAASPSSSSCLVTTTAYAGANAAVIAQIQGVFADIATYIADKPGPAKAGLAAAYPTLSAAEIDLAFDQQWRNWTRPVLTEADMRQEMKLLGNSGSAPNLDSVTPAGTLLPFKPAPAG